MAIEDFVKTLPELSPEESGRYEEVELPFIKRKSSKAILVPWDGTAADRWVPISQMRSNGGQLCISKWWLDKAAEDGSGRMPKMTQDEPLPQKTAEEEQVETELAAIEDAENFERSALYGTW